MNAHKSHSQKSTSDKNINILGFILATILWIFQNATSVMDCHDKDMLPFSPPNYNLFLLNLYLVNRLGGTVFLLDLVMMSFVVL